MPIPNYQIPGVYVTQSGVSLNSVNPTNLNIAIVADNPVPGSATDTFYNVTATSGIVGQLSVPMVNLTYSGAFSTASGFTVTYTTSTGVATATNGVNFKIVPSTTTNPFSYITTSGISGSPVSGTVNINYGHYWGAYGTYYDYNHAAQAIGIPVSGTTITNPALLATQFAFQNGANTVTILPVARLSSSGINPAIDSDWTNTFAVSSGTTQVNLSAQTGIDVVVPLYGFVASGTGAVQTASGVGSFGNSLSTYLSVQASGGVYQRAFIGVDGTANLATVGGLQTLASGFGSTSAGTRITLVYPPSVNYNPGLNTSTGLTTTNFNIPGYYVAAAVAGIFVGQTNVATPITNKTVAGFNYIPNQISQADAASNYLPYGITTVYQKRDGNFWILQGLTTNISNWLTQEISLNAIGDVLANTISQGLQSTNLIGGPLTQNTVAAAIGEVQGQLTNAVSNGLIQNYQNLTTVVNAANPTTINISFQYSPTYPINYIQVTLSLNTQTGQVIASNSQSNLVVY